MRAFGQSVFYVECEAYQDRLNLQVKAGYVGAARLKSGQPSLNVYFATIG